MADSIAQAKSNGSVWIWQYKGEEWPVMLCDGSIPPPVFMTTRLAGEIPAILLGRRKYIWVVASGLSEFEPHQDYLEDRPPFDDTTIREYDNEAIRLQKQRQIAFKQDAREFDADPAYWKNFIVKRKEIRELENEESAKQKRKRKRKRSSFEDGDDDVQIIDVSHSSTHPSKKQGITKGACSNKVGQLPTPEVTPMKSQSDQIKSVPFCHSEGEESDENDLFVGHNRKKTALLARDSVDVKSQKLRSLYERHIKSERHHDQECTIIVSGGGVATPFLVAKNRVGESELLGSLTRLSNEQGEVLHLPAELDIATVRFMPVADYLRTGDFAPHLIAKPGTLPQLEGLTRPEDNNDAAEKLAWVYNIATKLSLGDLQMLAMEKLRTLYPLSPLQLLVVTKIIVNGSDWDPQGSLMPWIVDHFAEYYFQLMEDHGKQLSRVLQSNDALRMGVHEKLASDPSMGLRGLDG